MKRFAGPSRFGMPHRMLGGSGALACLLVMVAVLAGAPAAQSAGGKEAKAAPVASPSAHAKAAKSAKSAKAAPVAPLSARARQEAEEHARVASEIASARQVFEANLDAIRRKDRTAYLGCYLDSDHFIRTSPTGFSAGFREFAEQASNNEWPDVFEASDLELVRLREGLVYGTYRYRVRFGATEQSGLSERLFERTDAGWKIALTTAFPGPADTPPPALAVVGATLLDGNGKRAVKDAVIVLRDGVIEAAGPRKHVRVPAGMDTLDARGLWVTPGLVDAHVHYSQTGWADGRPDAIDLREKYPYEAVEKRLATEPGTFHRSFLGSGVTAVFDVGGYPWTVGLQNATESDTRAPHVAAAGPLLTTLDHWLNLPAERQFIYLKDEASARDGVRYLKSLGSSAVKVWFIMAPNRDFDEMARLVKTVGDEAKRAGLPMIVHATGLKEAKAALKAGAHMLVHSVWDKPIDDEFVHLIKANHAIYCPTLTVIDGYDRMYESVRTGRAPLVDDPNTVIDSLTRAHVAATAKLGANATKRTPNDSLTQARHRVMAANLKRLYLAGVPIAMGTDAGNPLTLHGPSVYAEMEAMQAAGMPPMAVLMASTRGGATAMGRAASFGTVEAGKTADLLLLDGDPSADVTNFRRVRYVIRGGVARPIRELIPPVTPSAAR